ncbi:hypothetical protein QZH41_009752 [Actinostola sp. cb2023]|nr:hypothetical protein QZH41_009752 [Actinostola sp. cb2023]
MVVSYAPVLSVGIPVLPKNGYTKTAGALYAIVLDWPSSNQLTLREPITSQQTEVSMLGFPGTFEWKAAMPGKGIVISVPSIAIDKLPTKWAWVFKMTNIL